MLTEIYSHKKIRDAWRCMYERNARDFREAVLGTMKPFVSADADTYRRFHELFEGGEVLPETLKGRFDEARRRSYLEASQYLVSLSLKRWQYQQFVQARVIWNEDDVDMIDALEAFLQEREEAEFAMSDEDEDEDDPAVCERCDSPLDVDRLFCTDLSCPFSDHLQTCPKGWTGHPEKAPAKDHVCACRMVEG